MRQLETALSAFPWLEDEVHLPVEQLPQTHTHKGVRTGTHGAHPQCTYTHGTHMRTHTVHTYIHTAHTQGLTALRRQRPPAHMLLHLVLHCLLGSSPSETRQVTTSPWSTQCHTGRASAPWLATQDARLISKTKKHSEEGTLHEEPKPISSAFYFSFSPISKLMSKTKSAKSEGTAKPSFITRCPDHTGSNKDNRIKTPPSVTGHWLACGHPTLLTTAFPVVYVSIFHKKFFKCYETPDLD